jgi:transposase
MRKTQNAGALWLALVQAHPAEGFGRLPHVHEFSNVASTRTSAQNAIHHTAYGRRLRMLPWLPGPSNASSAVNSVPCTQKSGSRDTHTHTRLARERHVSLSPQVSMSVCRRLQARAYQSSQNKMERPLELGRTLQCLDVVP